MPIKRITNVTLKIFERLLLKILMHLKWFTGVRFLFRISSPVFIKATVHLILSQVSRSVKYHQDHWTINVGFTATYLIEHI